MMEKNERYIITKQMMDALFSETWIIDTLVILKNFNNAYYYIHGMNTAYICLFMINFSELKNEVSDNQIRNIVIATSVMHIGAISSNEEPEAQIEYAIQYLKNRVNDDSIIEYVKHHFEKGDGSGPFKLKNNDLTLEEKIIITAYAIDRLFDNLNTCKNNVKQFESNIMSKEQLLSNMENKYDARIVNICKDMIRNILPRIEKLKKYAVVSDNLHIVQDIGIKTTPVQLLIDSILENPWVSDLVEFMSNNHRDFLRSHMINTAINTATLILLGNEKELQQQGYIVQDVIIGALLHDIGYVYEKEINHEFHLELHLHSAHRLINLKHLLYGEEIIRNIFKRSNINDKNVISNIIMYHHEYMDGSGYLGMQGDEIPYSVKIVVIANILDFFAEKMNYSFDTMIETLYTKKVSKLIDTKFDKKVVTNSIESLSIMVNNWIEIIEEG